MATNLILNSHTFANSKIEQSQIKVNDFAEKDISSTQRKVKVIDSGVSLQPDIGVVYGGTCKYFINNFGPLSGKDIAIDINISASSVSSGTASYCDGYLLALIKRCRFMTSNSEHFKIDSGAIYQYYQRAPAERKELMYYNARIGATGADIAPANAQAGTIFIPTPFQDLHPLKLDLLRDKPYFEIEFNSLATILSSTVGGDTLTGTITSANILANYLIMNPADKAEMNKKTMIQDEMLDYVNYAVSSGATQITVDIPFNESEYIGFYITDNTTKTPFTGVSTVTDYHVSIDNREYPEITVPARTQLLQQTFYFRTKFDSGVYTLRFSSYPSKLDEVDDFMLPYSTLVFKEIANPKLVINLSTGLSHASTLHLFSYGRCWYNYADGTLSVIQKS